MGMEGLVGGRGGGRGNAAAAMRKRVGGVANAMRYVGGEAAAVRRGRVGGVAAALRRGRRCIERRCTAHSSGAFFRWAWEGHCWDSVDNDVYCLQHVLIFMFFHLLYMTYCLSVDTCNSCFIN